MELLTEHFIILSDYIESILKSLFSFELAVLELGWDIALAPHINLGDEGASTLRDAVHVG